MSPSPDVPDRTAAPDPRRAVAAAAGEWQGADAREIVAALEPGLAAADGRPRRITRLDRRPSDYSTSFRIEELDVTLDDGDTRRVLFKDLAWRSLLDRAAAVRPRFLYDPRREIAVYRELLAGRGLGTPTCYAATADDRAGRHWLFLEHVPAAQLCHVGDMAVWEQAARWLAGFHARFAGETAGDAPARRAVPLLSYDRPFYLLWPARAAAILAGWPAVAAGLGERFERLARGYGRVADRLSAMPRTLIHGEFYASNILVQDPATDTAEAADADAGVAGGAGAAAGGRRICPIDWELAAVAPGLFDVAALTAGGWTDEQRGRMLAAYHDALERAGGAPGTAAEMAEALEWCRLHMAVQWLGWAAHWDVPAEQSHDWLGQAVSIADRLGL